MTRSALAAGVRYLRKVVAAQGRHHDSDERLLDAFVVDHDETAFAVLVRRYGPMVAAMCRRVLGNQQDAEDALQATLLVLAQNASRLRSKTALASFLHGTAYRIALSAKRAAARRRKHEGQAPARPSVDPADELSWREVRALVDEEVARLPEKYRSAFILCCLENISQADAAQRLGIKEGTLSSRLTAARKLLAQRLTRRGVDLTAVLGVTALATESASALSPLVLATTTRLAAATAWGEGTTGLVSGHVSALAKSATTAAMVSKAKIMMAVILAMSVLSGVAAWSASANRLPLRAETPPDAPSLAPHRNEEAKARQKESEVMTVKGRILGPDGKPVKGVRLYSARLPRRFPRDDAVVALTQTQPTDAEGGFRIDVDKPDSKPSSRYFSYLIAQAPGLGVDWINLSEDDLSSEVTLRLVKDVPITGRVVNTEGRPVAGVLVSIAEICVPPNEKLDAYLLDWHQGISNILNILSSRRKRLFVGLDGISGKATTDKDGRFTLHGAGGERIVHVTFSGGGLAHSTPFVITRNGFDVQPYNAALHKYGSKFMVQERVLGLYPPEFTFIAEAGKTMEGVVKDAASGLPVAGCKVSAATSYAHGTSTVSNAEGKYHLEGLAKRADGHGVLVHPPKSSTYLDGVADQVADTPELATIRHDFGLVKGVIVSGRVVDKQTGKGVHCTARCLPLPGNKFIGPKQGFDLRYLFPWREIEAGEDGRFRLLTIPGKALLTVWVCERKRFNGELLCEYRQADPDPDHKELFDEDGDTCRVRTADDRVEFLYHANAVKVIDAKENGETRVELSVDWGATVRIVVQDTEGKPLPGVWAAGLADVAGSTYQLPEATATVYALNPVRPRMMVFYHAGKKLGGMATVRGDEKEPIVVKLAPLGKLSGRLVDPDGKSLQGVRVSINPQHENGRALYRWAEPLGKPVYTDKDGRFHMERFVPDLKFWIIFKKENTFFSRESGVDERQIRAGESVDMGTVRVRPST